MIQSGRLLPIAMLTLTSAAWGQPFVSPIGGTPYGDWTIVNYLDLDPTGGLIDYRGGNYTYDGHSAIDFTLPNFAAMDAGVPVYAAADGVVAYTHDGEYDRCSRVSPCGNFPNYIGIQHANGVFTDYVHLKKGSINVSPGQPVVAGQQIALVGSSGLSSDAHLHFTVREMNAFVETYQDPTRWWINPVPYAGDVVGSLDHGISDHFPSISELVDRPADNNVFQQSDGPNQLAVLWSHLFGVDAGDDFDVYFYRPNGTQYQHLHYELSQIRYGWWLAGTNLPNVPDLGTWLVEGQVNGTTIITDSFTVVSILGDYDRNGVVDASDYAVWRDTLGQSGTSLAADGNGDNRVDATDYDVWRANFGRSMGSGSTAAFGRDLGVPEPSASTLVLSTVVLVAMIAASRRWCRANGRDADSFLFALRNYHR
jgi:hypothetical protein